LTTVAPPTLSDPLIPGAAAPLPPRPWSHLQRILFRISFVYFLLFVFCYGNGSILSFYGPVGLWIDAKLRWPLDHLADFLAAHLFHITGIGATHHPSGSGDTAVQWVQEGLFLALALAGGLLWSAVAAVRGHRRIEYSTAHAWLRFALRLTCGSFMLGYGFAKAFPHQMQPISSAILNEPVGNMAPMTMLWSLIALHPAYEIICGIVEVVGGTLLLFRRTALLGALLSAFVMANVLLYNLFFDVPVKLFAANLLLALVFITLPDWHAMLRFFVLHRPAAPTGVWIPPASRRSFRIATRAIEILLVGTLLIMSPYSGYEEWHDWVKLGATHPGYVGAWHIQTPSAATLASPEHDPITDIYIDRPSLVRSRSSSGELWRTWLDSDPKTPAQINLTVYAPPGSSGDFHWTLVDPNHLTLAPVPSKGSKATPPPALTLTRIPQPTHYFLLDRGSHWVNEWGMER
jgi:hypothetical protein